MPPKKKSEPSKKTVEKKKDKVIEDKTFGIKNKKGKKQQQFIKHVTNQVKYGQQSIQVRESQDFQARKQKAEARKEESEMSVIFRPVQPVQKVSAGADPKSVLCLFFKQGQCKKGDKCKFSHDLSLEGKSEKKSLYVDDRDLEEDTIDKWDEDKLKEVVQKKHGGKIKQRTDIVCKHFLHAIEKGVYGWFWECPSGDRCIYRHALPPGFVFKKAKKDEEKEESITMEELVEGERQQLAASGKTLTKVTLETFLAWKERKLKEKKDRAADEMAKRKEAFKAGRAHGISGREVFEFNPELIEGDDQEASDDVYVRESDEEEEEEQQEVGLDVTEIAAVADTPAPVILLPRERLEEGGGREGMGDEATGGDEGAVGGHLHEASGGVADDNAIPIDEQLFTEEQDVEVDESLFDVENLEDLNICDNDADTMD